MDVFIHYTALPEDKELADVVDEINDLLDDHGSVCGGEENRLDLDLDDENINPKYAQLAVKNYLQQVGFPMDTTLEIGGMEIGIYL